MVPSHAPNAAQHPVSLRAAPRAVLNRTGLIHYRRSQIPAVLMDVSYTGAGLSYFSQRPRSFENGRLTLQIDGLPLLPLNLMWKTRELIGAEFALEGEDALDLMMELDMLLLKERG